MSVNAQRQYGQLQLEQALERQLGQKAQSNVTRALVRKKQRERQERHERHRLEQHQRRYRATQSQSSLLGTSEGRSSLSGPVSGVSLADAAISGVVSGGDDRRWSDIFGGRDSAGSFASEVGSADGTTAWSFESMALMPSLENEELALYPLPFDTRVVPSTAGWLRPGMRGSQPGGRLSGDRGGVPPSSSPAAPTTSWRSAMSPAGSHASSPPPARAATAAAGHEQHSDAYSSYSTYSRSGAPTEAGTAIGSSRSYTRPEAPPERVVLHGSFNAASTPAMARARQLAARRRRNWEQGVGLNKLEQVMRIRSTVHSRRAPQLPAPLYDDYSDPDIRAARRFLSMAPSR